MELDAVCKVWDGVAKCSEFQFIEGVTFGAAHPILSHWLLILQHLLPPCLSKTLVLPHTSSDDATTGTLDILVHSPSTGIEPSATPITQHTPGLSLKPAHHVTPPRNHAPPRRRPLSLPPVYVRTASPPHPPRPQRRMRQRR